MQLLLLLLIIVYIIAISNLGNVYIADTNNNRVRKITTTSSYPRYFHMFNIQLFFYFNNKYDFSSVTPTTVPSETPSLVPSSRSPSGVPSSSPSIGIITTIAGSSTSGSYSGDNGDATSAMLNYPAGLALDSSGMMMRCLLFCNLLCIH